jgi:FMN reductase
LNIVALVGNPSRGSRTLKVAEAVADAIRAIVDGKSPVAIDLADHGHRLFDGDSQIVSDLLRTVAEADFLIVASPVYKASYTGLLKAFLDRYDTNGLSRSVAIPVMLGGSPAHAMAVDFTLRPLLVELGASTPTRSLYLTTAQLEALPTIVKAWAETNRIAVAGAAIAGRQRALSSGEHS